MKRGTTPRTREDTNTLRPECGSRAGTRATVSNRESKAWKRYTGFFALDYFLLSRDFLTATVHLVFFLAVMKILTAKTNRDYLYTAAMAFVELLAAALLSIDFNFFLFLALYLLRSEERRV